jgi:hypothetical protein
MRVDQTGHQGATGNIDDFGAGTGDRPIRDFLDAVVLDEDVITLAPFLPGSVKHCGIGKNGSRHRNCLPYRWEPQNLSAYRAIANSESTPRQAGIPRPDSGGHGSPIAMALPADIEKRRLNPTRPSKTDR